MEEPCCIGRFFGGRTVLVTGATGFMGKVLVHKLLTACPDLKTIYLLIRTKRGVAAEERLLHLLDAHIFRDLKPVLREKVKVMSGDITMPGLGLSEADTDILADQVSVLFHSAATVKFDEDLSKSVQMNVEGTQSVVQLARKMKHLAVLVHVSTAFAHCHRKLIDENMYATDSTPDEVLQMCKEVDENVLNGPKMTSKVIGKHPNTYTFTKALTEQWLSMEATDLPIAIVRPSIVVAAWKKPVPGWVDNFNGPTGIVAGAASGILRTMLVSRNKVADLMPVDVAINLMCAVAWQVGTNKRSKEGKIPVYNCTSGGVNPITWGEIERWSLNSIYRYPIDNVFWYPGGSFKSVAAYDRVCRVCFHYVPAYFVDMALTLMRKRPFMRRIVEKMTKAMGALEYFSTREWHWQSPNVGQLSVEMEEVQKGPGAFDFRLHDLDWKAFMDTYVLGTRHYVLKNCPSTMDKARKKLRKLRVAHVAVQILFVLLVYVFFAYT